MAKTIKMTHEGIEYTLEFTRSTVKRLESAGFVLSDVRNRPVSNLPLLFEGALLAHHTYALKQKGLTDKIFNAIEDKEGLMLKLIEMYNDAVDSLFDEPEPSEKNAQWEANF